MLKNKNYSNILQQIYKVIANKFFIKINNNNYIVTKIKQLKTKNIENCSYFISINIKNLAFNISKIVLKKDINRYIIFI